MHAEPLPEHAWLQKLVGEWAYESECVMGPGLPPETHGGIERVRSLSVWVVCEGEMSPPAGPPHRSVMTLGYDPARKRFVGTFVASMMTHLWVYDGELDAAGRVLTLDAEGPSFATPGTMSKYKDAIEMVSDDHRVMTSRFQADDGHWHQFMTAHYRRTK